MIKYLIRVFSITSDKIKIKKYFKDFGKLINYQKINLLNSKYEYIIKIKLIESNKTKLENIIKSNYEKLTFKFKIIEYLKYKEENINPKIFINLLHSSISKKDIFNSLKIYGRISKIILCKNSNNDVNFSFVTFENKKSALKILKDYNNHYIKNNWVEIKSKKNNLKRKLKKKLIYKEKDNNKVKYFDDFCYNKGITMFSLMKNNKNNKSFELICQNNDEKKENGNINKIIDIKKNFNSKENSNLIEKEILKSKINNLFNF